MQPQTGMDISVLIILASLGCLLSPCGSQATNGIVFNLFTRAKNRQILKYGLADTVRDSAYDGQKPSKFLVHGWKGSIYSFWVKPMMRAILAKEDVNVIIVDWGKLAKTPYGTAAKNTRKVGLTIARFVEFLETATGTTRKNMHFIGHSLGGQTVGFAGQNLSPRPARVSGLDTAEGQFNRFDPKDYLDPTDADFVDEIYAKVSNNRYIKGHANFYPNGGGDAHKLPPQYYIESIKAGRCAYPAYACATYEKFTGGCRSTDGNHMGYYATKPEGRSTALYFLNATTANPCN